MADFNAEPYWDDFEATNGALEKNYMRILFRPGYAVQARELTQIQSIVQNQIKLFGNHIFQDGSPVIGGHLTLDSSVSYVKLERQDADNIDVDLENFLGVTVFNSSVPKTRARVIQTFDNETDRTLVVKYLRGAPFTAGQTLTTAAGATAIVAAGANIVGPASVVTINQGVFYVGGFFVTVLPQTIVLDAYSNQPSYRIGLQINEEIVTESLDAALLDPAQNSFNYQAPGAHRYQFGLELAKRTLGSVDDRRFFELLRVENGVITKQVSYPIYSELEKTLARRTYDESGNYAVKPFKINLTANNTGGTENTSSFIVNIEPGKAYVRGFEFETIGTNKLSNVRARTTKLNKDKELSVYYGNRLQITDIQSGTGGFIFSEDLDEFDIHCVPSGSVDLTGDSAKYAATKIGTAKLRNFDRAGSATNFHMYMTDVNFSPIITTVKATEAQRNYIRLQDNFSAITNAYVGGTISIVNSNGGLGNTATIVSYDGSTKIATCDLNFKTAPVTDTLISLSLPVSTAESVYVVNPTSYSSANLRANVALTSKVGEESTGNTYIEDASFDVNLFKIPNYYVKYEGEDNVDLYRRLPYKNVIFPSGVYNLVLNVPDELDFGADGELVSTADIQENLIVIPRTGTSAGQVLSLTYGSVTRTTNQSLLINTGLATFTGDVYVTVKVTQAEDNRRRVKNLVEANTALTAFDTPTNGIAVDGYGGVRINPSRGIAWFMTANTIMKVPGEKQSLFTPDVVAIKKIYDSANVSHAPNTTNMIDITDRYLFDSGQTDNYYDYASITLKPGSAPPSGQTAVLFDYFWHSGIGYLSAKSYTEDLYNSERIPIYKSKNGKTYNLRDTIDLRPIRDSAVPISGPTVAPYVTEKISPKVNVASGGFTVIANTSLTANTLIPPLTTGVVIKIGNEFKTVSSIINTNAVRVSTEFSASATNTDIYVVRNNMQYGGTLIQRPTDPFELDYEYYLPRIDKVVVTKDKEFKILNGVPSISPEEPVEDDNSMPICTMKVPPYTATLSSVILTPIENRRYTMKDISIIDEKVKAIDNYLKLKQSESDVISDPPKSPSTPTIDKPIYGTVVDEFDDLGVVDTNIDFACSIENGRLSTYKIVETFALQPTNSGLVNDKFVTLGYTEVPAVTQRAATLDRSESVQTAIIAKYEGYLTLTPESDYFYSTQHQPVNTNWYGRNNELRQETGPTALSVDDLLLSSIGYTGYENYIPKYVVGTSQPTAGQYVVYNYHYSQQPTQFEPVTLVPVPRNSTGAAPYTTINNYWSPTNNSLTPNDYFDYSSYESSWEQNTNLSASRSSIEDLYRFDLK